MLDVITPCPRARQICVHSLQRLFKAQSFFWLRMYTGRLILPEEDQYTISLALSFVEGNFIQFILNF